MSAIASEVRVGIFTIISLGALIYVLYILNLKLFEGSNKTDYYTITKNAEGVIKMTGVRINGVVIGKVMDVRLEQSNTFIEFQVEDDIKIPQGSMMELRSRGLLGETFLEIILAKDQGEYILSSELIPMNTKAVDFSNLMVIIGDIAKDIKVITGSLSELTQTDDKGNRIEVFFSEIEGSVRSVRSTLSANSSKINQVIDDIAVVTDRFSKIPFDQTFGEISQIVQNVNDTAEDARELISSSQNVVDKFSSGDGTVAQLLNDDGILDEYKKVALDVQELISPAKKLNINVRYRNEFRSDASSQHYLNAALSFRPERYYLFGVTQYPNDLLNKTTTTTTTNTDSGSTVVFVTESSSSESSIRYNAQLGQRFSNLALRFGLFESYGGFGGDYYLFDDKVQLSMDFFDFSTIIEKSQYLARIKLYSYFHLLKNIYLNFGIANLSSLFVDSSDILLTQPFFGAGFHFDDDDLRKIIGITAIGM